MKDNSQSRKYQITINSPTEHGIEPEAIRDLIARTLTVDYYCMCMEKGNKTEREHMHIFIYSKSPIRFGTLKNRFPFSHIEKAYGTVKENRDYVAKQGKWTESEKAKTQIEGTFYEWGNCPNESSEKAPSQAELIEMIQTGMTTGEIIRANPNYIFRGKDIDALREIFLSEKFAKEMRKVEVIYIFGDTGVGKSRYVYEHHDAIDICRITSYGQMNTKFDAYHAQPVLVFEEYASQINISDMLCYLDIYPLQLPARYSDRTACFTKVYILTNLDLHEQYTWVQRNTPKVWNAFLRRIDKIVEMRNDGHVIIHDKEEYLK